MRLCIARTNCSALIFQRKLAKIWHRLAHRAPRKSRGVSTTYRYMRSASRSGRLGKWQALCITMSACEARVVHRYRSLACSSLRPLRSSVRRTAVATQRAVWPPPLEAVAAPVRSARVQAERGVAPGQGSLAPRACVVLLVLRPWGGRPRWRVQQHLLARRTRVLERARSMATAPMPGRTLTVWVAAVSSIHASPTATVPRVKRVAARTSCVETRPPAIVAYSPGAASMPIAGRVEPVRPMPPRAADPSTGTTVTPRRTPATRTRIAAAARRAAATNQSSRIGPAPRLSCVLDETDGRRL
jgi:hypothetical protein